MDEATPTALCECGCGHPAPLAKQTDTRRGYIKGQPFRFVAGHQSRGRRGAKNNSWRGDQAGYDALHRYLREKYSKTGICEACGNPAKTEYALIKGRIYSRAREDYRELCPRCHRRYDRGGTTASPEAKAKISAAARQQWDDMRQGARDMRQTRRGEELPQAKLTEVIVRECRRRFVAGEPISVLAREFGVSKDAVRGAVTGRTWTHVP